ncbi:zinc finger protein 501-like [Anopheles nili]|uniref:zinc finger protein 501-like n=1 Tax=Anopheles nili TaxID=185578 RepID=UPI00237BABFB|nr:zinc finger protein 501-like [Anopheles nili]
MMDWDIIDIFNFDMDERELDISIRSILFEDTMLPSSQDQTPVPCELDPVPSRQWSSSSYWNPSKCTTPTEKLEEDSDQDSGHGSELSEVSASSTKDMAIARTHGSDAENDIHEDAVPLTRCCPHCDKQLPNRAALERHLRLHTDERPFRCPVCPKAFRLSSTLSAHKRLHDQTGPSLRCETCDRTFTQPSALSSHRLLHESVRPHACNLCGKQFVRLHALRTHVRGHANERPFQCDQCGKAFAEKHVLVRHRKTHSDERPHACPVCDKTFKERYDLLRHSLIHSGLRPHQCPECSKTFVQSNALAKHRRCHERERHGRNRIVLAVAREPTVCC